MEALAVLGLVSNTVQLIDAAVRAFNICRQVYTEGASIEDTQMAYTSNQLDTCCSALERSLKSNASSSSQVLSGDVDMTDLATKCCETAKLLHRKVESLRKTPGGGFWKTLSRIYLKMKTSRDIDKIKARLDEYQKVLHSNILISIRQGLGTLKTQFEGQNTRIGQQLSQVSSDLASCHISVSRQLKMEVDNAIKANEEQHILTRQHVESTTAAAVQELKTSQAKHRSEEKRERISQQKRNTFLGSLTFDEINLRKNEISPPHVETFEWMFDDSIKRPWAHFPTWLSSGEGIYWVNGKAGSGKSTLIKFLADHPLTKKSLALGVPDSKALIVTYYFWLSGTRLQRSLKGFLSSVCHQILLHDERLLEICIAHDSRSQEKRTVSDWSESDLCQLLKLVVSSLVRPICLFIDGLDEFDQQDDVDRLLSLVEEISRADMVKICVSSRPEHYIQKRLFHCKQLQLQDLTKKDMEIHIHGELRERMSTIYRPTSYSESMLQAIAETMVRKADGVFLWVHYVLSSLVRGLKNEDDHSELLRRIEDLPSEMQQLYLKMWRRLNGDEERYREEATEYFSYVLDNTLSLYEMHVALDKPLQEKYLDGFMSQNPTDIARDCERLRGRVSTRCAGLLEAVIDKDRNTLYKRSSSERSEVDVDHEVSTGTQLSDSDKLEDDAHDFAPTDETAQEVLQHTWVDEDLLRSNPDDERTSFKVDLQVEEKLPDNDPLSIHYKTKIKLLHRTARDFLLYTKEGQELFGTPKTSSSSRSATVAKARMATLIQGLTKFSNDWLWDTLGKDISHRLVNVEDEIGLVLKIKQLCEHCSVPKSPESNTKYGEFWDGPYKDFETFAAYCGYTRYVRHFIESNERPVTGDYLGYLIICTARGLHRAYRFEALSLISWLALQGADLHTKHIYSENVSDPTSEFFICLLRLVEGQYDEQFVKFAIETMNLLLPMMVKSTQGCFVYFYRSESWEIRHYTRSYPRHGYSSTNRDLMVLMSPARLYKYVMRYLEQHVHVDYHLSEHALPANDKIRVVFFLDKFPAADKLDDSPAAYMWFIEGEGWCPNDEDSIYIGHGLEPMLALDSNTSGETKADLVQELKRRLTEVCSRSRKSNWRECASYHWLATRACTISAYSGGPIPYTVRVSRSESA